MQLRLNPIVMTAKYCIIMAGGIGSRFWPLSKNNYPKQFLDVLGTGKSFIRSTFERFHPIVPAENFLVVTNAAYRDLVLQHLPELKPDQVLCEPMRRNTAPCIAFATWHIRSRCPDAAIVVTPADHLVINEHEFQQVIATGFDFVAQPQHTEELSYYDILRKWVGRLRSSGVAGVQEFRRYIYKNRK